MGIILESHSDESSTGDGNGVYLISGYAASDKFWGDFASHWAAILNEPPPFPPYRTNSRTDREWLTSHGLSLASAERRTAYFVLEHFLKLILSHVLEMNRFALPGWEHVDRINLFVHAQGT